MVHDGHKTQLLSLNSIGTFWSLKVITIAELIKLNVWVFTMFSSISTKSKQTEPKSTLS